MLVPIFQLAYLGASAAVVVWIARSVAQRPGFYLAGLGWAMLAMSLGAIPDDLPQAIQWLCAKIGSLLLVLGVMHRFDIVLSRRAA